MKQTQRAAQLDVSSSSITLLLHFALLLQLTMRRLPLALLFPFLHYSFRLIFHCRRRCCCYCSYCRRPKESLRRCDTSKRLIFIRASSYSSSSFAFLHRIAENINFDACCVVLPSYFCCLLHWLSIIDAFVLLQLLLLFYFFENLDWVAAGQVNKSRVAEAVAAALTLLWSLYYLFAFTSRGMHIILKALVLIV